MLRCAVQRAPLTQTARNNQCSAHFCTFKTVDTANYIGTQALRLGIPVVRVRASSRLSKQ